MGKRKTQDEIIQGFIEKHGNKYDYSKVSYVEATSEVIVTCLQHGDFKITPNKHKLGQGCLECSIIENSKKKREKNTDHPAKPCFPTMLPRKRNNVTSPPPKAV